MKRLKYLALGLVAICIPNLVSAAEPLTTASDLQQCLKTDGNVCVLGDTIVLTTTIVIEDGQEVELDLNGHNIEGTFVDEDLFYISNGVLEVTNSSSTVGTIHGKGTGIGGAFYLQGNSSVGGTAIPAELTIGKNVSVISNTSNCIYIRGKGAKAIVNGSLESKGNLAAIQGNGTVKPDVDHGNTEITINAGAVVTATNHAIYHPQSGTLTINGGTITGLTGIEMRSGALIINGGTITSTATTTTVLKNGDGSAVTGAAVAVAQHTTVQEASITINGGTLEGPTALLEATPEDNSVPGKVVLEVKDGEFIATNGGDAVLSENKTGFISGGTFSEDLTSDNAKNAYLATTAGVESKVDEETGKLLVGVPYGIELKETKNGKAEASHATALAGETVKVTTTPDKGYKVKEVKVTTTDGQKVEVKDNKFTMPENDVEIEVTFEVINPDTADNIAIYFATLLISVMAIAAVSLRKRYN